MAKKYVMKKANKPIKSKQAELSSRWDPYGLVFFDEVMFFQEELSKHSKEEKNESNSWNEWEDDWLFMEPSYSDDSSQKRKKKKKESTFSSPEYTPFQHRGHPHESKHANERTHESAFRALENEWEELPQSFDELARLDYIRNTPKRKSKRMRKKRR